MSRVRLDVDLGELAAAIAESVRVALVAQRFTIARVVSESVHPRDRRGMPCGCSACVEHGELVRPLTALELEAAFAELGANTATSLQAFTVEEDESDAGCSCGWRGPADRADDHECLFEVCGTVVGLDDGTTFRCALGVTHGGPCKGPR